MRWAGNTSRWVRPLHSILAVFDGAALDGELDLGGETIAFGYRTSGHRFLSPDYIAANIFKDYAAGLKHAHVILDATERRRMIAEQLDTLANAEDLDLKEDPGLLDEVTGLVEWPVALIGGIDEAFMDLPPEVLTTAMRSHQKYFTLLNEDGTMAPRFALVSNMETDDGGARIVAGNERVLRARLSDARFFWDQDRKETLSSRTTQLADITFHAKLGTLDRKVSRIQALAVEIAKHVEGADRDRVRAAARLAKADLVTGMVGEFPELQGLMGHYYALADDEHKEVADAIRDHYAPQGPNDDCPSAPVSVAVALADKIDTLVGFWAIDEKPTGSKDPYALRRAALGVIRLTIENGLRVNLLPVFATGFENYPGSVTGKTGKRTVCNDLLSFFADRVAAHLRGAGVRHDLIAAVFGLGGEDGVVRLLARVEALRGFIESDDGANLLTAFRRAANILRIEEKKDGVSHDEAPDAKGYAQDEEAALGRALEAASAAVAKAVEQEDFTGAMAALAALRGSVDEFFDEVTVNADDADLRTNRLRLLSQIRTTMGLIADFSQIEG
jgi:glycyl-tRNA synthetase beta chain